MPMAAHGPAIRLRGVRQNNLKGFDLDLPLNRLIVITGPSGSGKSSLAFDTLFAEGQRRYVETFSPYARQFFDRMDKPRADSIEGIPPAIAIEQRNTVRTTRSTVGTMTELCDHLKIVWPHLARLHCRQCGRVVRPENPAWIRSVLPEGRPVLVTFDLPLSANLSLEESLALIQRQGYQRLWIGGDVVRLEESPGRFALTSPEHLTVVQDRVEILPAHRARFAEACEQAYHFGQGRLAVRWTEGEREVVRRFSRGLHCAECDRPYREPTPALFSFNHPLGACPACRGFGRIITLDYERALPDRSRTLAQGVVKPWLTGMGRECQCDLLRFCRAQEIPTHRPFRDLSPEQQRLVIEGDPDYGKDVDHEWPRVWYGLKGYFRWLESKAYKMHVRVLLSRYRAYRTCPDCRGQRFQPDALDFKIDCPPQPDAPAETTAPPVNPLLTLADLYRLDVRNALRVVRHLTREHSNRPSRAISLVLAEIENRLGYLDEVGLGYLTLDRTTRSLSGGETERVNLTTCLGTRLVNTLYVLDEPSVGLHARDTARLVRVLKRLRDLGNTVVVVEHERSVIEAADQIVDLGPAQGENGGHIVFQGTVGKLSRSSQSLTGQYLGGRRSIPPPKRRSVDPALTPWLALQEVTLHNLHHLSVRIPLGRLVVVSGVSGSGKSTLIRDALHPLLRDCLHPESLPTSTPSAESSESEGDTEAAENRTHHGNLTGWEILGSAVLVDQSPLGRTPRSNPAVYTGAFDSIRELFAGTDAARRLGLGPGAFSFNSAQGQCQRCRGAGFEKIEMQFLSDVFIRCPECDGKRYRPHVLAVELRPPDHESQARKSDRPRKRSQHRSAVKPWNLSRLLDATIDDALVFLRRFPQPAAARAVTSLQFLQKVGLGYLRLGQPINTLSGGESQRLKLVGALAESARIRRGEIRPALYLLDEPTTGLHFDDVRVLLDAFQELVDAGHSVVVIEHNLDVIRSADWVIDLGPEAGDEGGRLVAEGTPESIMNCPASHTGVALRQSSRNSVSDRIAS